MIARKTEVRYYVGDCECKTLEEAQRQAIKALFPPDSTPVALAEYVADTLVAQSAAVIDILTTTQTSLPKARAVNGGRKPRKKLPSVQTTGNPIQEAETQV